MLKNNGFTLVELLVAAAVIGILAVVSTQMLFDTVTLRAKQNAIETTSDFSYLALESIISSIKSAKNIEVKSGGAEIIITRSSDCLGFRFNNTDKTIEKTQTLSCPPSSYSKLTPEGVQINSLTFAPEGTSLANVYISVSGEIKDAFSAHPFNFETNVFPRLSY